METPPLRPNEGAKPLLPVRESLSSKKSVVNHLDMNTQKPVGAVASASAKSTLFDSLERLLPIRLLQSKQLANAEWAWRREVVEALRQMQQGSSPNQGPLETAVEPSASTLDVRAEQVLQQLWNTLSEMSRVASDNIGRSLHLDLPFLSPGNELVSLAMLSNDSLAKLPKRSQAQALIERIVNATYVQDEPSIGSGFYNLAAPLISGEKITYNAPHRKQSPRQWVQWTAQRQTKVTSLGQLTHHLTIHAKLPVGEVDITILSANPFLSIHVASDAHKLCQQWEDNQAQLSVALSQVGWKLQSVTTSPLSTRED